MVIKYTEEDTIEELSDKDIVELEKIEEKSEEKKPEEKPQIKIEKPKPIMMNSINAFKMFKKVSCLKDIGQYGFNSDYRLRLINTDYILHIPVKTKNSHDMKWYKSCVETVNGKQKKIYKQVLFKEVCEKSSDEHKDFINKNSKYFLK